MLEGQPGMRRPPVIVVIVAVGQGARRQQGATGEGERASAQLMNEMAA